jgi:predicted GNAT superfamily acetyltransferase
VGSSKEEAEHLRNSRMNEDSNPSAGPNAESASDKAASTSKLASIEIRACEGLDELEACVRLQLEIWGYDASDVIPRRVFLVAQKIGGQVLGAFEKTGNREPGRARAERGIEGGPVSGTPEELVGFAFSLPGVKSRQGIAVPYLHSHMLAVRPEYRNRGIGVELKLAQRTDALSCGIRKMEWTFDPLEIKNAFINIHRLGAVVSTYRVNFYGLSSSRLQGGLQTDRLVAEWYLDSPRVRSRVEEHPTHEYVIERRIVVPAAISEWKAEEASRGRAQAVQLENRQKFLEAFNEGMTVLGFLRDADGNGVFELGTHPTDPSKLK